jgi:predicted O-methyltransferase YrrM
MTSTLRALLRRTPLYGAYKRLGHYPDYLYWRLRGRPVRSPHLLKQRIVRKHAREHGLRILVETGTYYGEMIDAMKSRVDRIYSIEFDAALAARARRRFARSPHIEILEGDSGALVPQVLARISEPALFWLDAGYYGWADTEGDRSRLERELEAILRHPVPGHVILLDDARGLDGRNGAPTAAELQHRIETQFSGRKVTVKHDILRIT